MHSLVQPNTWVAIKLPSGSLRILQATPNTTISLGKYGSFPSNLIIQRPFHITYELEDRKDSESFNRLRIVPASELYRDVLSSDASTSSLDASTPTPEEDGDNGDRDVDGAVPTGVEFSLVDPESGVVVAKTDRVELDAAATQTLSMEEIEALKRDGTNAGQDLIAKLMLSHTAIDQKTEYSLAKYKLLKTKKYIRRFSVLPLDVPLLDHWLLEEKDPSKILDMREEMIALLGCWANVHFGGEDHCETRATGQGADELPQESQLSSGRWLTIDDTGGLLVAAMAERMGVLYPAETTASKEPTSAPQPRQNAPVSENNGETILRANANGTSGLVVPQRELQLQNPGAELEQGQAAEQKQDEKQAAGQTDEQTPKTVVQKRPFDEHKHRSNDLHVPYSQTNTLTVIHSNSQPNLSYLRYYDFDITNPIQPSHHPLSNHLQTLTWLQLLEPEMDTTYSSELASVTPEELRSWKANRRGNYHRKRRRWARVRHVVDTTRDGGFSGLVVASTMDPISIMRHTVPLLAGGAPIAIYSQSIEPLTALMDCYSIARRAAWVSSPPDELEGKTAEELERWAGNDEFPLNPALLLGASLQTSRVRKWQVLPNRTHPLMTSRGGAEGYVFTAWRVKPAEGKVEARGKARGKKRKVEES